jgi:hypothetical protein
MATVMIYIFIFRNCEKLSIATLSKLSTSGSQTVIGFEFTILAKQIACRQTRKTGSYSEEKPTKSITGSGG